MRVSTIGAEMGQLESLRTTFDRQAQTIEQLTSAIAGQVNNTWWKGPAADRFRGDWESVHSPNLRNLQTALQECSMEISRRHQALTEAGT